MMVITFLSVLAQETSVDYFVITPLIWRRGCDCMVFISENVISQKSHGCLRHLEYIKSDFKIDKNNLDGFSIDCIDSHPYRIPWLKYHVVSLIVLILFALNKKYLSVCQISCYDSYKVISFMITENLGQESY